MRTRPLPMLRGGVGLFQACLVRGVAEAQASPGDVADAYASTDGRVNLLQACLVRGVAEAHASPAAAAAAAAAATCCNVPAGVLGDPLASSGLRGDPVNIVGTVDPIEGPKECQEVLMGCGPGSVCSSGGSKGSPGISVREGLDERDQLYTYSETSCGLIDDQMGGGVVEMHCGQVYGGSLGASGHASGCLQGPIGRLPGSAGGPQGPPEGSRGLPDGPHEVPNDTPNGGSRPPPCWDLPLGGPLGSPWGPPGCPIAAPAQGLLCRSRLGVASGRPLGSAGSLQGPPEESSGHPRGFLGGSGRSLGTPQELSDASRVASGRPPGSAGGLQGPPGGSGEHPRSRSPASGPRFGVGHVVVRSGALHWCRRCGAYAEHRFKSLKAPCSGPPGAGPRAGQLGRLLRGLHPLKREHLPRPVGL